MESVLRVVEELKTHYTDEPRRESHVEILIKGKWVKKVGNFPTKQEAARHAGEQVASMLLRFKAVRIQPLEEV